MNVSSDITQNEIDITKITKHVINIDVYENNLALISPKRIIVDISTDSFVQIMFKDQTNYFLFLNYVNFLDFYLNYYVNLNIVSNGEKPLIYEEDVTVYFKGGNVMNYHFGKMISDPIIKEKFANFFKKSDFDFSVNIHTHTNNRFKIIQKYTYQLIIDFLKKTTNLFNNYFRDIMNEIYVDPKYDVSILDNFRVDSYNEEFEYVLNSIKYLLNIPRIETIIEIANEFFKIYPINHIPFIKNINVIKVNNSIKVIFDEHTLIFQPKHKYIFSYNYTNYELMHLNDILKKYNHCVIGKIDENKQLGLHYRYNNYLEKSKYHAVLLYPYYKLLIKTRNDHEFMYSNLINDIQMYNFNMLQKNNFYTKEKIQNMIDMISNNISQLNNTYYDINDKNPPCSNEIVDPLAFNKYTIMKDIVTIIIPNSQSDFINYNEIDNPDGTVQIKYSEQKNEKNDNENIHYISVNYLIKDILGNHVTLDFDLFRIKFNLITTNSVLKNGKLAPKFKIPSEFIDVSVVSISSNQFYENKHKFIMPISLPDIKLPAISVKSHSYVYFINDLIRILFIDGNFLPWSKQKFEKRLKRLILFVYLYDLKNKVNLSKDIFHYVKLIKSSLVENVNSKELDKLTENIFIDSYREYNNIHDLVHIDPKYKIVAPFIKLFFVVYKLLSSKNTLIIINYYRQYIKYAPIENISNMKDDFIKFLDLIISIYKDLYFD